MVRLGATLIRRAHAFLPLSGHQFLAEEYRRYAYPYGGGKRPRDLSTKMTDALLSFMRTGSPNCTSLPEWPQYTPDKGATMMLNDQCEVVYDPDREARKVLTE